MATSSPATNSAMPERDVKLNYVQKCWRYRNYLVVEPIIFLFFTATLLNFWVLSDFHFEKACRANLGYSKRVCDDRKKTYSIFLNPCRGMKFENTTEGFDPDQKWSSTYTVCKAAHDTRNLYNRFKDERPIGDIFPLLLLLMVGGWADRYNKHKVCMIIPFVGSALGFLCELISAFYMDSLPLQWGAYLQIIVPALFGGSTVHLMAVYSYVTIVIPKRDRLLRFGIIAIFVKAISFLGQPIRVHLFLNFGFIPLFAMAVATQIIAIIYIIFVMQEINSPSDAPIESSHQSQAKKVLPRHSSFFDFFDPALAIDCIKLPFVKRPNHGRMLLILLICSYFLTVGTSAESRYIYTFARKPHFDFFEFGSFFDIYRWAPYVGIFIGAVILSKLLKFADCTIGLIAALSVAISRLILIFANDLVSVNIGAVVDLFSSLRPLAINAMGSSIVAGNELGKLFAIFGIVDTFGKLIFPPILKAISTISYVEKNQWPYFLFSEIFHWPNVLIFIICYIFIRRRRHTPNTFVEMEQKNYANEITRL